MEGLKRMNADNYIADVELAPEAYDTSVDQVQLMTALKALNKAGILANFRARIDQLAIARGKDFLRRKGVGVNKTANDAQLSDPLDNPINWPTKGRTYPLEKWNMAGRYVLPKEKREDYSQLLTSPFPVKNPQNGVVRVHVPEVKEGDYVILGPQALEPHDDWNFGLDPVTARILVIKDEGSFTDHIRALKEAGASEMTISTIDCLNRQRHQAGLDGHSIKQRIAEAAKARR